MQTIRRKPLFITLLATLILSTSAFLIMESSKYYTQFYPTAWQPLFLAVLLESFVITLAMARVYKLPLRVVQKILMLSVFSIIVMTASLHHVAPIINSISQSKSQDKIASIVKEEMQNLKDDLAIFDKQKQKLNTALSVKRRHSVFKSLLRTVNQQKHVSVAVYFDIAILIAIRLILQCCNLFCASMLGSYYRKPVLKLKKNRI
jgi:hypothetical protein